MLHCDLSAVGQEAKQDSKKSHVRTYSGTLAKFRAKSGPMYNSSYNAHFSVLENVRNSPSRETPDHADSYWKDSVSPIHHATVNVTAPLQQ